jgi:uncharacterized protein YeaO (DUF488 family)
MKTDVEIARAYGLQKGDGYYVLVDRLWPRGVARAKAPFDQWLKAVAPGTKDLERSEAAVLLDLLRGQ